MNILEIVLPANNYAQLKLWHVKTQNSKQIYKFSKIMMHNSSN